MSTIIVTNIDSSTNEKTLASFFNFCGEIKGLKLDSATGTAEVEFVDPNSVNTAVLLNNSVLGSSVISIAKKDGETAPEETKPKEDAPSVPPPAYPQDPAVVSSEQPQEPKPEASEAPNPEPEQPPPKPVQLLEVDPSKTVIVTGFSSDATYKKVKEFF